MMILAITVEGEEDLQAIDTLKFLLYFLYTTTNWYAKNKNKIKKNVHVIVADVGRYC